MVQRLVEAVHSSTLSLGTRWRVCDCRLVAVLPHIPVAYWLV